MKKVIEGKLYNTETALELASSWNGISRRDFGYQSEVLYKTKKGRYFLYGKGGAMSQYAEKHGDCFTDGEKITPLTLEEAKAWVEKNANDKYENLFDVEEA